MIFMILKYAVYCKAEKEKMHMKLQFEQIKSLVKFQISHGIWIGWFLCWWQAYYHLEPFSLNYFSFSPLSGKMNFTISLDSYSLFLSFSSLQVHKSQSSWSISNFVLKVNNWFQPKTVVENFHSCNQILNQNF